MALRIVLNGKKEVTNFAVRIAIALIAMLIVGFVVAALIFVLLPLIGIVVTLSLGLTATILVAVFVGMLTLALGRARRGALAAELLGPGEVAHDVTTSVEQASILYRNAFADTAGTEYVNAAQVVWVDGENDLLVYTAKVRIVLRDGFVLVGIPVFTEQTGNAEVVVPFAIGRPDAPLGLIMATETMPRGPAQVVERWGDQLTAAAWQALIQVAGGIAAAAGVDDQHQVLLPASLVAGMDGLTVTPQARHGFDRSER